MKNYIDFVEVESPSNKTKVFDVVSQQHFSVGTIKWFGAWRKYVFLPAMNTIFDVNCLGDIICFLDDLMLKRKQEKNGEA